MTARLRLTAEHRRAQIVNAARNLSYGGRLYDWNLDTVAEHVGITRSAVKYYFYSDTGLRAEIITGAVRDHDYKIVVQALAMQDPLVKDIPPKLRAACARELAR